MSASCVRYVGITINSTSVWQSGGSEPSLRHSASPRFRRRRRRRSVKPVGVAASTGGVNSGIWYCTCAERGPPAPAPQKSQLPVPRQNAWPQHIDSSWQL